jgi:HEAT repeat protein
VDATQQWATAASEEERLRILKGLQREEVAAKLPLIYQALGEESWRIRKEGVELFLSLPRAAELAGEVIELLHAEDNAGLRNAAVEILISLGRQAVPALLEEVSCADHDVRKFVIDILGETGDSAAVTALIDALRDVDENVRAAAAENLGKLGSEIAVPALIDALQNSDLLFRFTVLQALGQIGAHVPVARLLAFKDETLLRKALFDCLGRVGGPEALPALVEGLDDRMRNVREAAAIALSQIGEKFTEETQGALVPLAGTMTAEKVAAFLDSTRSELQKAAVKLLGWLADRRFALQLLAFLDEEALREEAVASLLAIARLDPGALADLWPETAGRQRAFLAYLIGEAKCEGGVRLLCAGLTSDNDELRAYSARALAGIGDAASLPALVSALADQEGEVREGAMWTLVQLAGKYQKEILLLLQPLLTNDDSELRMCAVRILGAADGAEIEKRLLLAMKDESSLVRQAALRALDGRAGIGQMPALVLALTDEDSAVRRLAAELLGAHGDPQALQPLQLALQDEDLWVRTTAVRSLGQLPVAESLEQVRRMLSDPIGLVVIVALETLAAGDPDGAYPLLRTALAHPDEEVVSAVLPLLARSGRQDWIEPALEMLLNHRHWEVRSGFARILAMEYGSRCRSFLEARLLVEGEDLVRQQIQDLLGNLPPLQD